MIKWKKAYKGPFGKREAIEVMEDLKRKADPEKNGIIKVAMRKRSNKEKYNVYIKTDI